MAITFVNAGAEGSAASGNITLGAPASPQNDDIWIAVVHSSDQVAHTFTDWTELAQGNGGSTTSRISVWYFRYAGSTPNLTVGHSGGQSPIGGITAWRGCKVSGSPANVVGAISGGTDASIEHSSITTTVDGCMLLACNGAADDNNRSTLPTDFTARFEDTGGGTQSSFHTTAGTPDGSVACHSNLQTSQGSTGTITDTQAAADPWASVLIALEPDARRRAQVAFAELEAPNAPRRGRVAFAELEVPNGARRAQVAFAEFETPNGARRARVAFAEFEAPNAPRRGRVSFAEFEVPDVPRRARVAFAELEVPDGARRARVAFVELETPDGARRGRVAFAEIEVPDAPGTDRRARVSFAELEVPGGSGFPYNVVYRRRRR